LLFIILIHSVARAAVHTFQLLKGPYFVHYSCAAIKKVMNLLPRLSSVLKRAQDHFK